MGVLSVLRIAGSALTAQRLRMDVTAGNIANAEATSTPQCGPYRREQVVFAPMQASALVDSARPSPSGRTPQAGGVQVPAIVQDPSPTRLVFDPDHPDAREDGHVEFPGVGVITEMIDMLSATRAYEANITVINVAKSMAHRALDVARG